MKLKIIGNLSDLTSLKVINADTGEELRLVQEIVIVASAGNVTGRATITILDMDLDVVADSAEVTVKRPLRPSFDLERFRLAEGHMLARSDAYPEANCRDCGSSCDPPASRCEECESAYRDATSCPTCGCPNTGGDTCDGCDEINRDERGPDDEDTLDEADQAALDHALEKDD